MRVELEGHVIFVFALISAEEGHLGAFGVYTNPGGRSFAEWAEVVEIIHAENNKGI